MPDDSILCLFLACLMQWAILYGPKEAPLQWHKKITRVFNGLGLDPCVCDPSEFVKREGRLYFALNVENGLCVAPTRLVIEKFLESLKSTFKITVGEVDCILVIGVERCRNSGNRPSLPTPQHMLNMWLLTRVQGGLSGFEIGCLSSGWSSELLEFCASTTLLRRISLKTQVPEATEAHGD